MALLGRLLLLVLMAAGPAIAASPMDDHTQQSPPGHRRLLATMPGRPSVTGIGTVGPTTVMYVDVTPPTSNGSSPITAYEVTGTPVGGLALGRPTLRTTGMGTPTTGVNSRRFTFVNYPRGVAYRFTVRALNRAGPSPASMTSTAFTTPKLGVPGPPMVTLTRLPAGVYLDVTPPTQGTASVLARPLTYTVVGHPDGGATAQRPRIVITGAGSLVPAGQAGAGSSSLGQQPGRRGGTPPTQSKRRFRITGHLPNTVYRFAVSAANSAGVGPESVQRIVFYECKNGFKDNGTGCKCPAILNCDGFMKDSCACSKCKPYHTRSANGSSCTCNIARTNCQTVAKDGCSCQACKAGWTSDGSGGCTKITGPSPQCAPLANCKTYSQVDCKCTQCNPGWGNCDNNSTNGCETRIDSPTACGSCNTNCTLANATPRCDSGTCQVASCARGWGNCDNNSTNGCETPLNTPSNCGSCNTTCALPQATATCATGTCQVDSCDAGWGNCDNNSTNGCETPLNTTSNCGSCNTACGLPQATATCATGTCQVDSCAAGWANCDNNSTNGCETPLNTTSDCGSCNTTCALENATPTCVAGTCQVDSCDAGWGNCDNNSTNGCETPLNTTSNCGSCNTTCALPQATATCATGTCQVDSCDAGWGNCDNNSTNGCETPLNTTSNCGSCNTACDLPQATASCATGTCQVDSCDAGWDDCDANPDNGCEASLSSPQHCGRCTSVCKAGQLCLEGRCVSNAMAWGYNEYGALGDNSTIDKTTPVSVAGGVVFSQISAGGGHTCGLNATGHAFCWGGNMFGVLGDNSNNDYKNTPTPVAGGIVFSQISAGGGHTCGLNATGHAFCWGCSVISIYCLTFTNTPVSVAGGTLFSQISAGYAHTCGLNATGHAFCWGDNRYGQLGYVPTVSSSSLTPSGRTTPVSVAGGTLFSQISAGYFHTCGLNATGHAFCWGYSAYGELGNDSIGSFTFTPVSVAGGIVFSQISAGGGHTCGLNATGHAFCWGWNRFGQLGDTSTVDKTTPVSAAGGIVFSQISAGYAHTCGLNATGHAFCWGSSSEGRLGDNSTDTIKTTPVSVAGGTTFNHISAGSIHTAALAGWGAGNEDPGIGCETRLNPPQHCGSCAPCSLPHATAACVNGVCTLESCYIGWGNCDGISTNGCETPLNTPSNCGSCNTTCALPQATATCATGTCQVASCDAGWGDCDHPFVLSWGQNSDYQLGDGTTTSRSTPASVSASIFFQQISAGFTHTCGLDRSGSAFCWGSNVAGRLGKSYILRSETPDTVSGDVKFRMISAGNAHTCGLEQSSGHAFCWGSQFVGGGTMFGIRSEPVIVDGGISFAQISAGGSHTCGIESGTGLAWCWGRNSNGQLGIAAIGDRNTPTSVFGDLTFAQISAGDAHTCGLESLTGKAFCWGSNEFGRLGNGTTGGSVNTPVSVAGGFSFSQISAGATHTCAIEKVSGRAFCWGWNVVAQLGNNAVGNSSSTPISVSGGTVFTHIDAGAWHNCGLTTTGEAFCWGENVHGELGDGTNANQYAPVRVFGDTVFKQISAGWWHTVALAGWGTGNEDPGNGCETPLNTPQHCGSCAPCSLPHATADCVNGVCAVASCDAGWGDYDNDDANGCETLLETN